MTWHLTGDVGQYLSAAGEFLRARPAEHTILLTVAEHARLGGAGRTAGQALFGWWTSSGGVAGAFVHLRPYPAALSQLPADAAAALPAALAQAGDFPPGAQGPAASATAFASAWQARTGCLLTVQRRTRLWQLGELQPPDPSPPGAARLARNADRSLLIDWVTAFGREVKQAETDIEQTVGDRLGYGGFTLWETAGQPVSLAGLSRPVAGHVRVGPVYTPPQFRGCGFAAAVATAVSRAALAAGARPLVLFTDLSNPASNDLFERLGYEPLADYADIAFSPARPQRR